MTDQEGNKTSILNTKKNNLVLHFTKELPKNTKDTFQVKVNEKNRLLTENNHSATHLLHHALRKVLGTHVEQKGSLVNAKYLRFDFSHFSKVTSEELEAIENEVNHQIQEDLKLEEFREIPMAEAIDRGALALFGEKYGDQVRMIAFVTLKSFVEEHMYPTQVKFGL